MNTKFILALILTLQVSMSLCQTPTPSAEVVAKCNIMRATFYKRLLNAYARMHAGAAPLVEGSPILQSVSDLTKDTSATTYLNVASAIASGIYKEANPLVERAVAALQNLCVESLSSVVGPYLDGGIGDAKFFLDKFMPAE